MRVDVSLGEFCMNCWLGNGVQGMAFDVDEYISLQFFFSRVHGMLTDDMQNLRVLHGL